MHLYIVEQFGRFPDRNGPLGRENTPEEEEFLAQGGMHGRIGLVGNGVPCPVTGGGGVRCVCLPSTFPK